MASVSNLKYPVAHKPSQNESKRYSSYPICRHVRSQYSWEAAQSVRSLSLPMKQPMLNMFAVGVPRFRVIGQKEWMGLPFSGVILR